MKEVKTMKTMQKNQFIKMAKAQAYAKMENSDRRRRLDGRLELATIEIFGDLLPQMVKYEETSKNLIKMTYLNLNLKYKNLHLLANNTPYQQEYCDTYLYTYIVVIKATHKGIYKGKTENLINIRLTLAETENLINQGLLIECDHFNINDLVA